LTHIAVTIAVTQLERESGFDARRSCERGYPSRKRECLLLIAVSMPGFDAHRSYDRSYAIGKRECLLHVAVSISGFEAHCNYAVGNRECLLHIVSMPGFDVYRNCYKGSLLYIAALRCASK
jgi:hypothetical protein